jgi:excisionase family DNA binding protein
MMTAKTTGLLHPHHVAELLACSDRHVRELINTGELVAYKIGRRSRRITKESLSLFLEKNKVDPETIFE